VGSEVDQAGIILSYWDCSLSSLTINSSICFIKNAKHPFPAFQRKHQKKNPKQIPSLSVSTHINYYELEIDRNLNVMLTDSWQIWQPYTLL